MNYYRNHKDFLVPTLLNRKARKMYILLLDNPGSYCVLHLKITNTTVARVLTEDGRPLENFKIKHLYILIGRGCIFKMDNKFMPVKFKK